MITLGLIKLFLTLPIFSKLNLSDDVYSNITCIVSNIYSLNSVINLDLLIETVFFCLGVSLLVALACLIRWLL